MTSRAYRGSLAVLCVLPLAFSAQLTPGWAGPERDRPLRPGLIDVLVDTATTLTSPTSEAAR